jgi:polysaccharide pyruvyl transferase WcaK-like protein
MKVGLLTPYVGTNLGDGAIQTSLIDAIRRELPEAQLWGITLSPSETRKRHNIPCFPLTGLRVAYYSESLFAPVEGLRIRFSEAGSHPEARDPGPPVEPPGVDRRARIWSSLKAIPIIGSALKLLLKGVRNGFLVFHEVAHLVRSLKFVKSMDMVIVAGGGQLDEEWGGPWGHPYVLFRWAILAKIAGTKFVVLSVGAGRLRTLLGRLFIRQALALACYRSYRDQVSKGRLQSWKFTRSDPCVPDLAFGLELQRGPTATVPPDRELIVGISPIAFGHARGWPTPAHDIYARYLSALAEFAAKLDSIGYAIVLFTSSGIDRLVVTELLEQVTRDFSISLRDRIRVPRVDTVDEFFVEVSKVDVVVASRLHGTILSHMLGKPVLAISFDPKVDTHMRDVGQGGFLLDIRQFTADDLMGSFELLVRNAASIRKTVNQHLLAFRASIRNQYEKLATLL